MFTVAVTDQDWFNQLRGSDTRTVNYWSPTPWNPSLARLEVGSPFCFMVKGPRKIGGYGLFHHYENLRASEAWSRWGAANGNESLAVLVGSTTLYARRRSVSTPAADPEIGCFILHDTVYFNDAAMVDAAAVGIDFHQNIVKLKYFDGTPSFVSAPALGAQTSPPAQASSYRRADETIVTETRTPFAVDPDTVDRGLRAHRALQNQMADFARASGFTPESPRGDPNFDVGWWDGQTFVVVEVKSLSATNEVGQMRLGIGQVLDYAHHYESRNMAVRAVLAVEREPDAHWLELCAAHRIRLVWPGELDRALR